MDINEIKQIIEEDGGKIIIVEQGKPIMVITSFEEYRKKKVEPPARNASHSDAGGEKKAETSTSQEIPEDELKIEDLPF